MDPIFEKNLITTKEAGDHSGYSSDYLARLARSGKIDGKRIGHSWFIDKESLTKFLDQQGTRKIDYARALAREREIEYRKQHSFIRNVEKTLSKPLPMPSLNIERNALRSQAIALSVALLVVVSGAFIANAAPSSRLTAEITAIAREVAFGFNETFGNIPSHIALKINSVSKNLSTYSARVIERNEIASAEIAPKILIRPDLSSLQMVLADDTRPLAQASAVQKFRRENSPIQVQSAPTASLTVKSVQSSLSDGYAFVTNPSRVARVFANVYSAIGDRAYASIVASLSEYHSLITHSGTKAFSIAVATRDIFPASQTLYKASTAVSRSIDRINFAFGNSIINTTHRAIQADVLVAYGLSDTAPASARVAVVFVGTIGDAVAGVAGRVPALATTVFLRATEAPATFAPAFAQTIFDAEYAGASPFVAFVTDVSDGYLSALVSVGRFAYATHIVSESGYADTLAFTHTVSSLIVDAPATLSANWRDAYLGMLGKTALAFDTIARVPKVATALSALHSATQPMLAAVAPALSAGEQVALVTYKTITDFFDSANRVLATLIGPPPTIVMTNPPAVGSKAHITPAATMASSSTPLEVNRITYSSPTYTTVVKGISEDFMNQSLASLRSDVLATVAGMIQPVSNQVATNVTTIQQVNMIQDLSNLIVRNGDFRGGTFSGNLAVSGTATFTNAPILSSLGTAAGTFLAVDATGQIIATTTPSGGSGGVGSGTTGWFPYYAADGTNLTATSSLFLAASGNIGIGTTSPYALLSISNSASTPIDTPLFTIASTTAGTSTTTLMTVLANGNVGIGTADPGAYKLSVNGKGYFTANTNALTVFSLNSNGIYGESDASAAGNAGVYGISSRASAGYFIQSGTIFSSYSNPVLVAYRNSTLNGNDMTGAVLKVEDTTAASGNLLEVIKQNSYKFVINSTGNLGIGTTSPYSLLSISNSATTAANTPLFTISSTTAGTSTTTLMTVLANGNIGIGTGSPSDRFTVQDIRTDEVGTISGINSLLTFTPVGSAITYVAAVRGSATVDAVVDIAGALEGGNFSAINNMNSNTVSFAYGLHAGVENKLGGTIDTGYGLYISSATNPSGSFNKNYGIYIADQSAVGSTESYNLYSAGAASKNYFAGLVGIGTTSPYALLSIGGDVVIGAATAGGTLGDLYLPKLGTPAGTFLAVDATGKVIATTTPGGSGGVGSGTTGWFPYYAADGTTLTATSSIFLAANGNVGIGIIDPTYKIDVAGQIRANSLIVAANGRIILAAGSGNTGNDGKLYNNTSTGDLYIVPDSTNGLVVKRGGNVGIATTSPFASLSIAGIAGGTTNLFAISTSTAAFATTTALTINQNGDLSLLNGANLSVGGNLTVTGTTNLTGAITFPLAKGNFIVGNDAGIAQATSTISISSIGDLNTLNINNAGTATTSRLCFGSDASSCMNAPVVSGSNITLYHWNGAADIAGYEMFRTVPDTTAEADESCLANSSVAGGYCDIDNYVSTTTISAEGPLMITKIPPGTFTFNYFTYVDSAAGVSKIESTIYKRTALGVETYIGQATSTEINNTSAGFTSFNFTNISEITFASTDRLVSKVRVWTNSPSDKTIHFIYGGTAHYSNVSTPMTLASEAVAFLSANNTFTGLNTFGNASSSQLSISGNTYFPNGIWNSSGSVGIGTTSPATKLDVFGNVNIGTSTAAVTGAALMITTNQIASGGSFYGSKALILKTADSTSANSAIRWMNNEGTFQTGIARNFNVANSILEILDNTTTKFIINSVGNVGIGTTSPYAKLSVVGPVVAEYFHATSTTATSTFSGGLSAASSLYVLQNGNVGIGTASPEVKLQVAGQSGTGNIGVMNITGYDSFGQSLVMQLPSTGYTGNLIALMKAAGGSGQAMGFSTHFTADAVDRFSIMNHSGTENLTVLDSGNVGVGTTSPYSLLSISNSATTPINTPLFTIASTTAGTSTTTLMTVLANGNVGIGTTLPADLLHIKSGNIRIEKSVAGSTGEFGRIAAWNTFGTQYEAASVAFERDALLADGYSGAIVFNTRNDLERMRITSNGSVGIGTTSPYAMLSIGGDVVIGAATAGGTLGDLYLPKLGTAAGTFIAVDATGKVIATTTPTGGSGTVTSVDMTVPAGLSISGNPITTSGTLALTFAAGYSIPTDVKQTSWDDKWDLASTTIGVPYGGTGATTLTGLLWGNGTSAVTGIATTTLFSGTTGQFPYFSDTGTLTATSSIFLAASGNIGIGTTTPNWLLQVAGIQPSFVLSDTSAGENLKHWLFSSMGGNLYIGTSTDAYATTTPSALSILNNGNVGIGTSSPAYKLDVAGSASLGSGDEAMRVDSNGNIGIGTSSPAYKLDVAAGWINSVSGYKTNFADYAEYFWTEDTDLKSGEVVCVDIVKNNAIKRCERGADNNVMGIVSTNPAIVGNNSFEKDNDANYKIIGLLGQVPAMVSAENGPIAIGDSLTSASSTPGYAMRADAGDSTVGVALESLSNGTSTINVLISRRNKSLTVEQVENQVTERIANMKIEDRVQQLVTDATNNVVLGKLTISGTVSAGAYRMSIAPVTGFTFGTTTVTAKIPSEVLTADGESVDLYKLATYNLSAVEALSTKVDAHEVRLTSLETRIDSLESGAVSSSSGTSTFSTTSLASAFEGFGVLIQKGIAQFNTLVFRQLVASKDADGTSSAGSVSILTGNTVAQVNNSLVMPSTKVFITFNSQIAGSWWVSDKAVGSFRVVLSEAQPADVSFDYFLVQTEGALATSTPEVASGASDNSNSHDTVPPVITLLGDNPIHISVGGVFIDPGITAIDAVDGIVPVVTYINGIQQEVSESTISASSQTTYIITYAATDSAGNNATPVTRSVIVGNPSPDESQDADASDGGNAPSDTTSPVVTLVGDAAMQITANDAFTDPGATALDDTDGDITMNIVVTGSVDMTTTGLYTITYTATDVGGNVGTASRVVTIVAAPVESVAPTE